MAPWSWTTKSNSTISHSGIFAHNWELGITTPRSPTLWPTSKLRSRTDLCSKSSRLGSKGQRIYGQRSCQVYYGHTRREQEHLQGRYPSNQHTRAKLLSLLRSDSRALEWRIMMRVGMMRPCAYNWTQWTRSEKQSSKGQHDTRTSWPSTTIPKSSTWTFKLEILKGPYRITSWQRKDTYYLETLDGLRLHHPWNIEHLNKYYQWTRAYRPPLLISSLFFPRHFYCLQHFQPKGQSFIFSKQFVAYALVYHNKRSYSNISCTYIHFYKTTSTTKSKSGRIQKSHRIT